ncbi:hypothetical protein [Bacillus proteolyticus]|uniref:hypothetical protein n=1 Tax=Bacillus proteolyticus TaxID=2026192 RepID=UPI003D076A7B
MSDICDGSQQRKTIVEQPDTIVEQPRFTITEKDVQLSIKEEMSKKINDALKDIPLQININLYLTQEQNQNPELTNMNDIKRAAVAMKESNAAAENNHSAIAQEKSKAIGESHESPSTAISENMIMTTAPLPKKRVRQLMDRLTQFFQKIAKRLMDRLTHFFQKITKLFQKKK